MKPLTTKQKEIKRTKFRFHWYKSMVKLLRNQKFKDYRNDSNISLT